MRIYMYLAISEVAFASVSFEPLVLPGLMLAFIFSFCIIANSEH